MINELYNALASTGGLPAVTLESLGADASGATNSDAAFLTAAQKGGVKITYSTPGASFKLTQAVAMYTSALLNAQSSVWEMWGATITTTSTTDSIFADRPQDGTSFRKGITILGGTWVGSGIAAWSGAHIYRCAFTFNQWTDITIIGGDYSNFTASAAVFRGCGRVRVLFTTIHDICAAGGYNGWNFSDSINGNTVTGLALEGQFTVAGCYAYSGAAGIPTAPFAWVAQEGNYTAYDADCSFCLVYFNGFSGIFNEVNSFSSGAGDSVLARVILSDSIIVNTSTGQTAGCVYYQDDGGSPFTDAFKLDLHRVDNCILASASNSTANAGNPIVYISASRSAVSNTTIIASGTNGRCLAMKPANAGDATVYQDLDIANVDCFQTNTAALSRIVEINPASTGGLLRFHWSGGSLVSSITAQAAVTTADGFFIGSTVQSSTIENVLIDNPGNNGLTLASPQNCKLANVTIHNPNACNTASTGSANGIAFTGTAVGNYSELSIVRIYDDRGTHQMNFGLNCGTAATTKFNMARLVIRGALTLPMTTTTVANIIDEIEGYSSDVMTGYGFNATTATVGASVWTSTAQPYDQAFYVRAINGATAITESRNSTNLPVAAGQIWIRRKETISVTWATTAPTYTIVPQPG